MSSLRVNSILVTGISPSMLKARVMGSKTSTSGTSGTSTTEELLEEDSGSELLTELLELEAGLEEVEGLEEVDAGLEDAEEEEELELEPEEPLPSSTLMPSLLQTAVKVMFPLYAATPVPG